MRIANQCKSGNHNHHNHIPVCKWPDDCLVQWGDCGIVLKSGTLDDVFESDNPLSELADQAKNKGFYTTAFFEAFPNNPDTFIRGEGKNITEAEENAFKQFVRQSNCEKHEFERRHYTSGAGICKHCDLFLSRVFEPTTKCCKCKKPTCYGMDKNNNWYCEECYDKMPEEDWPEWRKRYAKILNRKHENAKNNK